VLGRVCLWFVIWLFLFGMVWVLVRCCLLLRMLFGVVIM